MRRKVIQDFANLFCQRVMDLPDGYDTASFAHYGSGKYKAEILTGQCSHNGGPIPKLRTWAVYDEWLCTQLEKHGIQRDRIEAATLEMNVVVGGVSLRSSYGHRFASAHFSFECPSEIRIDEKSYGGWMIGKKEWGFDWYYERLYGALRDVWPSGSC
ncbi:MAG TPA: hypothetical protein VIX14_16590 [Terriglobales bacterium]